MRRAPLLLIIITRLFTLVLRLERGGWVRVSGDEVTRCDKHAPGALKLCGWHLGQIPGRTLPDAMYYATCTPTYCRCAERLLDAGASPAHADWHVVEYWNMWTPRLRAAYVLHNL